MRQFAICLVLLTIGVPAAAAIIVIPDRVPPGARAIVVGAGLADADVEVTTPAGPVPAVIVTRAETLLELIVPRNASTGPLEVKSGGASLGSAMLTVTAPPPFLRTATLASSLGAPSSVAVIVPDGRIVVAEPARHQVRILSPSGATIRVIGSGKPGFRDGIDSAAQFKDPAGVAIDPITGVIYVADRGNHAIRRITTAGVETIAGSGKPGFRDASGSDALLKQPAGVAIVADGTIFVADTGNHAIRRLTASGDVTTICGTGAPGYRDGAAPVAQFHGPETVVASGDLLFIADTKNHAIRAFDGVEVRTVAGTTHPGSLDGSAAIAEFHAPAGIVPSEGGELYIGDTRNHLLRTISGEAVDTLTGTGKPGYRDGPLAASAFHEPRGLAYAGALYAADSKNGALRVVYSGVAASAVYPAQGDPQGGETIRVFGAGFVPGATSVNLGGVAGGITYMTSTELFVTTPPHPLGTVDIAITTPAGTAILQAAYEYAAPFVALTVSPDAAMVDVNGSIQFTATGTSSDGITVDLTGQATWSSSAPMVAIIGSTGLLQALSPGEAMLTATYGELSASAMVAVRNPEPPLVAVAIVPSEATLEVDETLQFSAIGTASDGATRDVTSQVAWSSGAPGVASMGATGLVRGLSPGQAEIVAALDSLTAAASVTVRPPTPLPPDPTTTATTLSATELTSFAEATKFLYSGEIPIQTGVAAGTIVEMRASVTRGVVRSRDGAPLGGVTVRFADHPEFGSTLTRADGGFDLVLNGGTTYTLSFEKSGYIDTHRKVYARWQDFAVVGDVVMIRFDVASTTIATGATEVQIARASPMTDDDGSRRATMLVPRGTTASILNSDGSTTPLASLTLRMTEYTVGARGPEAMPASLPPQSAYTYCVELSADEAIGHAGVTFDRPLAFYVENFLGFPTGGIVPSGYYDRRRAAWIPSDDGRVVTVTAIAEGLAALDITGDGIADPPLALAGLGIDDAERAALAGLYRAGDSLWRVPVTHFTPYDFNWPWGPVVPEGETAGPPPDPPEWSESVDDPTMCPGSIVRCDNQTLGETIPITGTPFHLVYESGRVRGRAAERNFELRFTGGTSARGVRRIDVRIEVAGIVEEQSFSPGTTESMSFSWNGRDAYGRLMTGAADAHVSVSYVYDVAYQQPVGARTFGALSGEPSDIPAREPMSMTSRWTVPLGGLRAESAQLGGWTLSPHHMYDYSRRALLLGSGEQQSADLRNLQQFEMTTAAGMLGCCADTSGVATRTRLDAPFQVGVGADGSVYLNEWEEIRRITPEGRIERVAGTGKGGFNGDGPATSSQIDANSSLAIGSDGAIYLPDRGNYRVRRIKDGVITTIAGNGEPPEPPEFVEPQENVPATEVPVEPADVAVSPDGTVYFADRYRRIRRITPDGLIRTYAGGGTERGDGIPARRFRFDSDLEGLALGPDGSIYVAEEGPYGADLRRIGPDGTVGTVLENGPHCESTTEPFDGPVATACLEKVWFLRAGPDGSVYIPDQIGSRVRMITPDGIIRTIAGNGASGNVSQLRPRGVATGEILAQPFGAAVGPDGSVYVTDAVPEVVRRITPSLSRFTAGETVIPAASGNELYVFSGSRHLRTLDALTGAVLLTFTYDAANRLVGIGDFDGNQTLFERDGNGHPLAIVAPGGQRTTITVDSPGYLTTITNPAGESFVLTHNEDGLLRELRTPRLNLHTFAYDDDGRLQQDRAPDGYALSLTRSGAGAEWNVATTTALGRTTITDRQRDDNGTSRHSSFFAGLRMDRTTFASGVARTAAPDGMITTTTPNADPRLGITAPLVSGELRFPSGRALSLSRGRTVTLADPDDILSALTQTDTFTIDGRTTTARYDAASRELSVTTPGGRSGLIRTDDARRPLHIETPGLAPADLAYSGGLLTSLRYGARTFTFAYDAKRRLTSITDPLQRQTVLAYDDDDRLIAQRLTDGRAIQFGYDAGGNLTSVTPPSRPSHQFTFTAGDQQSAYHAPMSTVTRYDYDGDRKLRSIIRPDQSAVTFSYDAAHRLDAVAAGDAEIRFARDSAGRIASTIFGDTALSYTYDGSLLTGYTMSGGVAGSISYSFDSGLRVSAESVNGTPVALAWDGDDLLTQAGDLLLARDAGNGLLTGTTLGPASDSLVYNEFGEVTTYSATLSGTPLLSFDYTRDHAGRITAIGAQGFEYDLAGRLVRVTNTGAPVAEYTYDANGNRTSHTFLGGSNTATYDEQDRLLQYGDATFTYTANGELESKTLAGATTTFDYDAFGNLREVVLPGGSEIEYVLDGQNRRVGKKVGGVLVRGWLYADQLRIVAEVDQSMNVVSRFVYGSRANTPDYMIKGGVTYRILSDHLGSPRLVVNVADGTVAQSLAYDEFGNVVSDTNPGFQPFGFAGGLVDLDTGLVRFGARDYDPHTGRFLTKDPVGFAGGDTNLYAYVLNDPINLIDPMGTDWVEAMEPVGNFFAGMGDTLSFGLTTRFNEWTGASAVVDKCSGAFRAGEWTGTGVSVAFGASHLGRNALKQGVQRLAYDNRTWGAVRSTWSGRPGTLRNTGRSLHHWLIPQRAISSGAPQGIVNAGFNYMPISAGLNSYMNGATATRTAVEWGFKGTVAGIYGGAFGGGSGSDGCGCP